MVCHSLLHCHGLAIDIKDGNAEVIARAALDSSGNLFIDDDGNGVIRKVNTSGSISTFATNAGFSGVGAIATDSSNNSYVVD